MIGFFIKKAFFNGWDNLFQILLVNIVILVIGLGGFYLAGITAKIVYLSLFILLVTILLEGTLLLGVSVVFAKVANYSSFSFGDVIASIKETWKHGLLYSAFIALLVLVFSIVLPYYLGIGNFLGFTLAVVMFWLAVILTFSLQWFMPIRSQLDKNFIKSIKKCFIIFFDNPGFSVFMFLYSFVLLALSCVLVLLMPGIAGLLLAQNEAFRLRMYKYDWLEKNPDIDIKKVRKEIPWAELLAEDMETVGTRTLKNFIFPWKD